MASKHPSGKQIVDMAMILAEQTSWEEVRLHQIADHLKVDLAIIHKHYAEKDDLVEAWFDRADQAMLELTKKPNFYKAPVRMRLQRLMMAWFGALEKHHQVTRQMIYAKLEPGHLQTQIPAVFRISRTVQWLREAAHQKSNFVKRAIEETGLTSIFLMSFYTWLNDDSVGSHKTAEFVAKRLVTAEKLVHWMPDLAALLHFQNNIQKKAKAHGEKKHH